MRTPSKSQEMSFYRGLNHVMQGKRITRSSASDDATKWFVYMLQGYLTININGVTHDFTVRDVDISARDWVIIE